MRSWHQSRDMAIGISKEGSEDIYRTISVLKQNLPGVHPAWYCGWNIWELCPPESADLHAPWRKNASDPQQRLGHGSRCGFTESKSRYMRIYLLSIVGLDFILATRHRWHMPWLIRMISTFQATMRQALPKSCNWLSFKGTRAKNLKAREYW